MGYLLLAMAVGAIWGALGLALAGRVLGTPVWGGVLISPVIGLAIAVAFPGFRHRSLALRIASSLVSLYLAAGLFGLGVGVADALRPIDHRKLVAVVIQPVIGMWWGVTYIGYLPLLWPLAYFTHSILGRLDPRHAPIVPAPASKPATARWAYAPQVSSPDGMRDRPARELEPSGMPASPSPPAPTVIVGHGDDGAAPVGTRRAIAMGALAVAGTLVVLSALRGGRGLMGELVRLLMIAGFALVLGRMAWRRWKAQPMAFATTGIFAAFGVAIVGWLFEALVHALSRVSSENYGMIIIWPLVLIFGAAVICGGALAVAVGVAAVVTAVRMRPARRALIIVGGAAAVVLNLLHLLKLTRLIFTG